MGLHPYFQELRTNRAKSGWTPLYELEVEDARRVDLMEVQQSAGQAEPVHEIDDLLVSTDDVTVPIRIYRPRDGDHLPALMYFFGGGWTLGTLETCDAVCRRLANRGRFAVVAVAYRLAPEHKFPSAVDDCFAATTWVATRGSNVNLDRKRVAVGGDSAGGNLAAAVALAARDRGGPTLAFQVLIYPVTDYMADTESMRNHVDPYLFNRLSMQWYWDNYLESSSGLIHSYAAPLREEDLRGLPPGLVITAEFDPLHDEGEAYARSMLEAGVSVELTRYEGMAHGFFTALGELDEARVAADQVADRLKREFESAKEP